MEMQMGVKKKNLFHTLRYKYIDLWSCPLNYLAEQVKSMTNYRNRLVIIPSGIDLSRFKPIDRSEARKRMDLPMDRFIFGLAGRFDPQKGQLLLLEAMAKCKNTEFSVVFLGEPTLHEDGTAYYNLMQDSIEKNDLGNRIFIRPFMADIEVFYSAIDWFVMATKAETFGMVTLEALACGTPVLGSNAGGTPELLDHGANGVLFAPMDSTDLSKKIELIMTGNFHFGEEELIQHASHFSAITVCDRIEEELMLSKG
jgi:glycosyltransferase involved in cell wall biosynthesis